MGIPINGLIWMGDQGFMQEQIDSKLDQGFSCLKMKIGAINFDEEYRLLKSIRDCFNNQELTLRVDANGAFDSSVAYEVNYDFNGESVIIASMEDAEGFANWDSIVGGDSTLTSSFGIRITATTCGRGS